MSAFLLSDDLIETLAVWSLNPHDHPTHDDINGRARALFDLNVESLQARYPGDDEFKMRHDFGLGDTGIVASIDGRPIKAFNTTTGRECAIREFNPRVVVFAARCADYQCCEFEDYKSRIGYKVIEMSMYHATSRLMGETDDLHWGDVPAIVDRGQVNIFELLERGHDL
jgi:hypothetical protein